MYRIESISQLPPQIQSLFYTNKAAEVKRKNAIPCVPRCRFGSELEDKYYNEEIYPEILTGQIESCDSQKEFVLFPADNYCGIRMKKNTYKLDFFIKYKDGRVKAVEVKNAKIRKLQREYPLKRRVFIELFCKPNRWEFVEYIDAVE